MNTNSKSFRLIIGVSVVSSLMLAAFIVLPYFIHTWGAKEAEIDRAYPGDELAPGPLLRWTHAITIDAPVSETWPWIIQMGESRGGFYSYTFIQNLIAGSTLYKNANRIINEYQNPHAGDEMIGGILQIHSYKKNDYLLATSMIDELGWTWLWSLSPTQDGGTRLVVRMNIKPEESLTIPAPAMWIVDVGGFVMEQNMLQGIKQRAEGEGEPILIEMAEIAIWLSTLFIGLIAAWLFFTGSHWPLSLSAAVDSVIALFVFTFVQPDIGIRFLIILALLGELGVVIFLTKKQEKDLPQMEQPVIRIPWKK